MNGGRRRLGRGLEALLGPESVETARAEGSLRELPVEKIRPNPYQPRHAFDESQLSELADSMASAGLLQPVVVRARESAYELIAGERRWRAAQRLGWEKIGAVVRDVDDQTVLTLALIENLQRDALSAIDEARGYQRLVADFGVSHGAVGELVGRSRTTVANALRLLKLPDAVQELVHQGTLSAGHARALLAVEGDGAIEAIAKAVVERGLSVRDVEQLVRARTKRPRRARGAGAADPDVRRVEESLRRRLQTDVRVSRRGKDSGKIGINFYSHDDLARIMEIILGERYEG